jgi:hypothetical protein
VYIGLDQMDKNGIKMSTACMAVFLLMAFGYFLLRQSPRSIPKLTDLDVAKEMVLRADQAVAVAKEKGIVLDYSPESVEKVEEILAEIYEKNNRTPLLDSEIVKESLRWGGYIGEVARKIRNCRWALDSKFGGEGSFPIVSDDKSECFPVRWCAKRIKNGEEDNVWHKFNYSVLNHDLKIMELDSENNVKK